MAISKNGIECYTILDHNCKKVDFIEFIDQVASIIPQGKRLLMDNVAFHHSIETVAAVKKAGFTHGIL